MIFYKYISIVITIISISCLTQLFFSLYQIIYKKNNQIIGTNNSTNSNFQKIMEDLDKLVQRKCYNAYMRVLKPYVSKSLKNKPLINDKVVNEISITITKEILDEMSISYRNKLEEIYNKDKLDDIILELVYNIVTEMAMNINKDTINKMNWYKNFNNISKNDFDN